MTSPIALPIQSHAQTQHIFPMHSMTTRSMKGISKPKVFHHCYLADNELKITKLALQDPKWLKAMQEELTY